MDAVAGGGSVGFGAIAQNESLVQIYHDIPGFGCPSYLVAMHPKSKQHEEMLFGKLSTIILCVSFLRLVFPVC